MASRVGSPLSTARTLGSPHSVSSRGFREASDLEPGFKFPNHAKLVYLQAVLEDSADKLAVVSSLKPVDYHTTDANLVGKAIEDRKEVEALYQQLLEKRVAVVAKKRDNAADELVTKYRSIRKSLETNILSEASSQRIAQIAAELRKEKAKALDLLQHAVVEAQMYSECRQLHQVVEEETKRELQCEELAKSIEEYAAEIRILRQAIKDEDETVENTRAEVKVQVSELQSQLRTLKDRLAVTEKMLSRDYNSKVETLRRTYANEEEELRKQLLELQVRADRETVTYDYTKKFLTNKVAKAEEELQNWTDRHEKELAEVTSQLNALTAARAKVLNDLKHAEDSFKNETTMKAEREAEEARLEKERIAMHNAALLIQCVFRGFLARKVYQQMKKEAQKTKKSKKGKDKAKA